RPGLILPRNLGGLDGGEVADQFQSLAFAARQRVDGLAQFEVTQADLFQQSQGGGRPEGRARERKFIEETDGLLDGRFEQVADRKRAEARIGAIALSFSLPGARVVRPPRQANFYLQDMRTVTPAVAIGAANEDVAEELHLDLFEAGAAAPLTLALGRIEAEGAGVETPLFGDLGLGEEIANVFERADVDSGIGTRRFAENGLIDEHDPSEMFAALQNGVAGRGLGLF